VKQEIKSALMVFGFICTLLIPSYFIYKHLVKHDEDFVSSHTDMLKGQYRWVLASQKQYYSDLQSAKKWYTTKAWIYYKWQSENEYGIDFGNGNWNWHLEYNEGIANVTVPTIQYFGPKISLGKNNFSIRVVNKALGVPESELISKHYDEMNKITKKDGQKLVSSPELIEICRKSVAEQVMSLLNQANSNLKVHKVNVMFSNEKIIQ
jgi:hypothetical protein